MMDMMDMMMDHPPPHPPPHPALNHSLSVTATTPSPSPSPSLSVSLSPSPSPSRAAYAISVTDVDMPHTSSHTSSHTDASDEMEHETDEISLDPDSEEWWEQQRNEYVGRAYVNRRKIFRGYISSEDQQYYPYQHPAMDDIGDDKLQMKIQRKEKDGPSLPSITSPSDDSSMSRITTSSSFPGEDDVVATPSTSFRASVTSPSSIPAYEMHSPTPLSPVPSYPRHAYAHIEPSADTVESSDDDSSSENTSIHDSPRVDQHAYPQHTHFPNEISMTGDTQQRDMSVSVYPDTRDGSTDVSRIQPSYTGEDDEDEIVSESESDDESLLDPEQHIPKRIKRRRRRVRKEEEKRPSLSSTSMSSSSTSDAFFAMSSSTTTATSTSTSSHPSRTHTRTYSRGIGSILIPERDHDDSFDMTFPTFHPGSTATSPHSHPTTAPHSHRRSQSFSLTPSNVAAAAAASPSTITTARTPATTLSPSISHPASPPPDTRTIPPSSSPHVISRRASITGTWIECREAVSGRVIYYNPSTMMVRMDPPTSATSLVSSTQARNIGINPTANAVAVAISSGTTSTSTTATSPSTIPRTPPIPTHSLSPTHRRPSFAALDMATTILSNATETTSTRGLDTSTSTSSRGMDPHASTSVSPKGSPTVTVNHITPPSSRSPDAIISTPSPSTITSPAPVTVTPNTILAQLTSSSSSPSSSVTSSSTANTPRIHESQSSPLHHTSTYKRPSVSIPPSHDTLDLSSDDDDSRVTSPIQPSLSAVSSVPASAQASPLPSLPSSPHASQHLPSSRRTSTRGTTPLLDSNFRDHHDTSSVRRNSLIMSSAWQSPEPIVQLDRDIFIRPRRSSQKDVDIAKIMSDATSTESRTKHDDTSDAIRKNDDSDVIPGTIQERTIATTIPTTRRIRAATDSGLDIVPSFLSPVPSPSTHTSTTTSTTTSTPVISPLPSPGTTAPTNPLSDQISYFQRHRGSIATSHISSPPMITPNKLSTSSSNVSAMSSPSISRARTMLSPMHRTPNRDIHISHTYVTPSTPIHLPKRGITTQTPPAKLQRASTEMLLTSSPRWSPRHMSMHTLMDPTSRRSSIADGAYLPRNDVRGSFRIIRQHIESMLEDANNLSLTPQICADIRAIRDRIISVQESLDTDNVEDHCSDMDALLGREAFKKCDQDAVQTYRAHAAKFPHSDHYYHNWHMPEYLSTAPLPAGEKSVIGIICLPQRDTHETLTHTRITITSHDTVDATIHAALTKYNERASTDQQLDENVDYVLKAMGLSEYMDGTRTLFSYEYVRHCIRNSQPVELIIIPRPIPHPHEWEQQLITTTNEYTSKIDTAMITRINTEMEEINITNASWHQLKSIPLSELRIPFRIRICGIDHVHQAALPRYDTSITHLFVRICLFHGTNKIIHSTRQTEPVTSSSSPRWMEWLRASKSKEIDLSKIPPTTRVCFLLYGRIDNKPELLAWSLIQLIDVHGHLLQGEHHLEMWPMEIKEKEGDLSFLYRATMATNRRAMHSAILTVQFDKYMLPVVCPSIRQTIQQAITSLSRQISPSYQLSPSTSIKHLTKDERRTLITIMNSDPLYKLSTQEMELLWKTRSSLIRYPHVLPKFLQSVEWSNPVHVLETYRLIQAWAPPFHPIAALELLDAKFADPQIHAYAVSILSRLADDELQLYLLQLTQCLKFQPYHDSALTRLLISRALANPYQIGHHFYWHLKAEMGVPDFAERYSVILEEYLSHAGVHAIELRKQHDAVLRLQRVAELIVKLKLEHKYTDTEVMKEYCQELEKLNRDFFTKLGSFQIPLNPKLEATTLIVDKCRFMSSKKLPLWLVFNNADEHAPPIYIIFKAGDDLRQDILTLQLLKVMDKIWLNDDLDMRLKPYKCIATGMNAAREGVGMIEVVMDSDTTSGIQLKYGGGAIGALKLDPLDMFIRDHNHGPQYDRAVENFIRSCAGYCVATFVLGIGDRHNGNIMVTKDGHLFHIDFGHFLGNFKKKFGFNRERAAFVFTPEMAYVMGGRKYQKSVLFKRFQDLCCRAFIILRKHASLLETLFILMVSAGMPELSTMEDVGYLRDMLLLDETDREAEKRFKLEIKKSLDTTWRRIDNWIHNAKHGH